MPSAGSLLGIHLYSDVAGRWTQNQIYFQTPSDGVGEGLV